MAGAAQTLLRSEVSSDPESKLISRVEEVVRELNPTSKRAVAALDSRLDRDLGIDSLGRAELVPRIEHSFGVNLPERILGQAETPRDLLAAVLASQSTTSATRSVLATAPAIPVAAVVPFEARTLCSVLDWHAQRHPDRPHITLEEARGRGTTLSYDVPAATHAVRPMACATSKLRPVIAWLSCCRRAKPSSSPPFAVLYAGRVPVPIYPPVGQDRSRTTSDARPESSTTPGPRC